ncbi:hypothetical protein WA1_39575 [Scytonema hofmannii PCC 7110]|uniref:DUF5678 domain-containing protein n=1 Tax=Scytonema hofmannii PCC 7110 TaxID=128403 RepID=A0A139WYW8_9CYAN|nr:hypothetical protein [Scytonema hofmannii]KYC37572.1 hypothetical protein WA1_39575 [Scytonema hofmannii PCC 7110]
MSETTSQKPARRRGRIFPEITILPEELAKRKAEDEVFYQRCWSIFERVRSELIEHYSGWYIAVEPDSGDYFIDEDKETATKKARQKHPNSVHFMFCLNETGATGRI